LKINYRTKNKSDIIKYKILDSGPQIRRSRSFRSLWRQWITSSRQPRPASTSE